MKGFIEIIDVNEKRCLLNINYIISVSLNPRGFTHLKVVFQDREPYIETYTLNESIDEIKTLIQSSQ